MVDIKGRVLCFWIWTCVYYAHIFTNYVINYIKSYLKLEGKRTDTNYKHELIKCAVVVKVV
jgi:hypothetical protein